MQKTTTTPSVCTPEENLIRACTVVPFSSNGVPEPFVAFGYECFSDGYRMLFVPSDKPTTEGIRDSVSEFAREFLGVALETEESGKMKLATDEFASVLGQFPKKARITSRRSCRECRWTGKYELSGYPEQPNMLLYERFPMSGISECTECGGSGKEFVYGPETEPDEEGFLVLVTETGETASVSPKFANDIAEFASASGIPKVTAYVRWESLAVVFAAGETVYAVMPKTYDAENVARESKCIRTIW